MLLDWSYSTINSLFHVELSLFHIVINSSFPIWTLPFKNVGKDIDVLMHCIYDQITRLCLVVYLRKILACSQDITFSILSKTMFKDCAQNWGSIFKYKKLILLILNLVLSFKIWTSYFYVTIFASLKSRKHRNGHNILIFTKTTMFITLETTSFARNILATTTSFDLPKTIIMVGVIYAWEIVLNGGYKKILLGLHAWVIWRLVIDIDLCILLHNPW